MGWYRCLVRGENFPGSVIDERELVGFYTTRWVEADSTEDAEVAVLKLLRSDSKLALRKGEPTPTLAKVDVEEIASVRARKNQGSGFSWWSPMNDSDAQANAKRLEQDANWR